MTAAADRHVYIRHIASHEDRAGVTWTQCGVEMPADALALVRRNGVTFCHGCSERFPVTRLFGPRARRRMRRAELAATGH